MSSSLFSINTAHAQARQGGESLNSIIPVQNLNAQGGELSGVLNQLFYLGLAAAAVLAVAMIVRGGIQYMASSDSSDGKGRAKRRIQAAVGGLVLAFASVLLLQTINPSLTKLNLRFNDIKVQGSSGTGLENQPTNGGPTSGTRPTTPTQPSGNWTETGTDQWAKGLATGERSLDGRLVISAYGSQGDDVTDSNTAAGRGNADNLLREGSVALSPDLIDKYKPATGAEVFINGVSVGFYEDATAGKYKGTTFNNTIDIYDTNGSLGGIQNFGIKNIPAGQWNISFGPPRAQIANPSN